MDDVAALRAHAIPLAGTDPELAEDDLAPLLERLAGARLVGLGEATHGDHESFQFKARLIRALVPQSAVRLVLFEAGPAEMDPLDRYVTGASDSLPMGSELHPWRTEEVRDLFVWLREWNTKRGSAGHVARNGAAARQRGPSRALDRAAGRDLSAVAGGVVGPGGAAAGVGAAGPLPGRERARSVGAVWPRREGRVMGAQPPRLARVVAGREPPPGTPRGGLPGGVLCVRAGGVQRQQPEPRAER